MADVHLPGVGGVSKKALMIGGAAAAAIVGLILLRKKSAAQAPAAATSSGGGDGTTGNPSDPNSIDPNTGMTYGAEASAGDYIDPGLQDTTSGPTYGATGYYDPNTGQWVYGNSGTGQAAATTNAAWVQDAIAYLGQNGTDTTALATALGAYIAGQPVTSDQEALIDQAIAAEGYPPTAGSTGYPPGINVSATGTGAAGTAGATGGVTASGTGTGTTGTTGTTTTAPKAAGAISNLRVTGYAPNGVSFAWNAATGATGGYSWALTGNGITKTGKTTATHVSVSGLNKPGVYNFGIQALPGGPGNNIHTPSLKG